MSKSSTLFSAVYSGTGNSSASCAHCLKNEDGMTETGDDVRALPSDSSAGYLNTSPNRT